MNDAEWAEELEQRLGTVRKALALLRRDYKKAVARANEAETRIQGLEQELTAHAIHRFCVSPTQLLAAAERRIQELEGELKEKQEYCVWADKQIFSLERRIQESEQEHDCFNGDCHQEASRLRECRDVWKQQAESLAERLLTTPETSGGKP